MGFIAAATTFALFEGSGAAHTSSSKMSPGLAQDHYVLVLLGRGRQVVVAIIDQISLERAV